MFRSAYASDGSWHDMVERCINDLGTIEPGTNLGFLYVTEAVASDLPAILDRFQTATNIENWVGSVGLGVCVPGKEYFDAPAIAVLAARLPENTFRVLPTITESADGAWGGDVEWESADRSPFALIHSDTSNAATPQLVQELAQSTAGFLVGGLTASNTRNHQIANEVTGGGVSGVVFSPEVEVVTSLSQGCTPIGEAHTVTEATENIMVKLDGKPAYQVFCEDIGEVLARDINQAAGYIHAALPVAGSDIGDYVVRNLVGVDAEQGLVAIAAPIESGDRVLFVRRDPDAAREDLVAMLERLKRRAGGKPKGGIYVSCVARGPHMFGAADEEMGLVAEILKDVPIIGFYANGEISNNRLYAYTGVLSLFV